MSFQTFVAGFIVLAAPLIFLIAIYRGRAPGVSLERSSRPVGFWSVTLAVVLIALFSAWFLWTDHPKTPNLLYIVFSVQVASGAVRAAIDLKEPPPLSTLEFADDRVGRAFLRIGFILGAALFSIAALLLLDDILFDIL